MATLFDRDVKTIGKHIHNAMHEELEGQVVVAKFATTTQHGAMSGKTQTQHFLDKNGILYDENVNKRIADYTLVALTIMIAESRIEEKEMMVSIIMNCI